MESECIGGIERHLADTRQAVIRWLQHENKSDEAGQDDLLFSLSLEDYDAPEQPQILKILREQRRFDTPYWDSTLRLMPHLFRLEMNEAINAEIEYRNIEAANARLKDLHTHEQQ